jgi:lysophospholipase L1-like esterase
MRFVAPDDVRPAWRGVVSLQHGPGWVAPWRVPHAEAGLYFPTGGLGRGAMPAGVRIALLTTSPHLRLRYDATPPPELNGPQEISRLDLELDGVLTVTRDLDVSGRPAVLDLDVSDRSEAGRRERAVRLWLPAYGQFRLRGLEVVDGARLRPDPGSAPRWVHYGSSVSQGRGAASPARAWTAQVARRGLDLTNLAVGAGAHAQPLFAQLVRDRPADVISACVGINVQALGSLIEETYLAALIGFVRTVRERHPRTPLLIVSAIHAPDREQVPGPAGLTLADCRRLTGRAVDLLVAHGDANLHLLDGLDLFGADCRHLMLEPPGLDRLHPAPAGHDLMADRFAARLASLVRLVPERPADPVSAATPHEFAAGWSPPNGATMPTT